MQKTSNRFFCLLGDGECAEGSVWEAANLAGFYKLDNLIAIVDQNSLGQAGIAMDKHNGSKMEGRFKAFGFNTRLVNGHNVAEILEALEEARSNEGAPFAIIGVTNKGHGFGDKIANLIGFHGTPMAKRTEEVLELVKSKMTGEPEFETFEPETKIEASYNVSDLKFEPKSVFEGQSESTRYGFGLGLLSLGAADENKAVISLDADVKNSTFSYLFAEKYPERKIDCFIAEQNMVSMGLGAAKRNLIPFCSTFACFLTRAFDQIRMGAISEVSF